MTDKSPTAFRTISEVAVDIGVPQHVLRFWETKFTALKPMKRGGNRRYYRPDDVDLLRSINRLLYTDGYTIKGVQKLLRENGAKGLASADAVETALPVSPAVTTAPATGSSSGADAAFLASLRGIRNRLASALSDARAG